MYARFAASAAILLAIAIGASSTAGAFEFRLLRQPMPGVPSDVDPLDLSLRFYDFGPIDEWWSNQGPHYFELYLDTQGESGILGLGVEFKWTGNTARFRSHLTELNDYLPTL